MKNKMYQFPQKYCAARLFSTLIIIRNVSYYTDFRRSCDFEDWSNNAECWWNKWQLNTYSHRKQLFYIGIIFHIFFFVFWSNKCSLAEQKRLLSNTSLNAKQFCSRITSLLANILSALDILISARDLKLIGETHSYTQPFVARQKCKVV